MTRPQIQAEIPGTEAPTPDAALLDRLWSYFDARDEQKRKAADTKLKLAVLFAAMAEAGIERLAYLDPASGKRRYFTRDQTPRPKIVKEPRTRTPKAERAAERKAEKAKAKRETDAAEAVEHRKVSRESVEAEIGRKLTVNGVEVLPPVEDDDPFEQTRRALEGMPA